MEKQNPRLDLQAVIDGKLQRVEIPQYALKYPNFNRIPLAAVKTDIYNPEMATFTQNQNDDFHCRLSYENARSNTTLNHDLFKAKTNQPTTAIRSNVSYPIGLVGDIKESYKNAFYSKQELNWLRELDPTPDPKYDLSNKSCISGREFENQNRNIKLKPQFRYNRIRMVPDDRPTNGRLPSYLTTTPGVDSLSVKYESATASSFRKNDNLKYSTMFTKVDPFRPYGNNHMINKNLI